MSNFYSNTRKQLLGCMKMNGKQRIVTTALQILLETKGLVAPVCTLLLGFLLCTISSHLHCWPGSDCSERPKVQDLFAVPTQLWIASLGYPRQVFQVVFVSGLFSSSVCFHQNVDVLSCFVLETLFTHVTSSNSWFHTFGLLLLSTSWAQPVSHHASHVCWTNNNMLPPPFSSHVSISGRHRLECDTFTDPENVNQKCWKQLRFPSKYEPLNSLKCLHNTFPTARLYRFLVWAWVTV